MQFVFRGTGRLAVIGAIIASTGFVSAGDWTRFRGPNGSGVSPDSQAAAVNWSDTENIKWKAVLPGPGLSSPVLIGDRIILTCWTGYAAGGDEQGSLEDLKREVVCLDRATGETVWTHAEPALLPESSYRGMFAENGYASHTPVTDGENVYVFFGKSGVLGLNLATGDKLWQQSVGTRLEERDWGSASSPIIFENLIIVPAFIEGDALVAINKATGEIAWEQKTPGYAGTWSTPILVEVDGDRTDLVMSVPGEVWGLNPASGKLRWYCEVPGSDSSRASVIADGDVIVATASSRGGGGSIAIRTGGKGDVSESHVIWKGRDGSGIGTPVIHNNRLYLVNGKVLTSVDMATGERVAQTRLTGSAAGAPEASEGEERNSSRRGGYGRGPGGQDYSSPVVAGNQLYYAARSGDIFVVALGDETKQLAVNGFGADRGEFNSTPAISDGELFIRSRTTLYCVTDD